MMAKITKGSSFGGCVRYVMDKKEARLISAKGVLVDSTRTITDSLNDQAKMNPRLGKTVGHISLNFSAQDNDSIDNAYMLTVAKEYMQRMGITNTQYIVVRHNDREHPHCHIVFNRVSDSGKTISDQNDRHRSVKACKAITEKYGLYIASGKENVKRERLRDPDRVKYEIYDAVRTALPFCSKWNDLQKRLEKEGISITYKFKGTTGQKEGVIFSKNDRSFNGSMVDRQFSFSKIDAALEGNACKLENRDGLQAVSHSKEGQAFISPQLNADDNSTGHVWPTENVYSHDHSAISGLSSLFDIPPAQDPDDELMQELIRKKKRSRVKFSR